MRSILFLRCVSAFCFTAPKLSPFPERRSRTLPSLSLAASLRLLEKTSPFRWKRGSSRGKASLFIRASLIPLPTWEFLLLLLRVAKVVHLAHKRERAVRRTGPSPHRGAARRTKSA